ncbi:hypothetical protein [Streptomyces exfoliatus]|uniref:hypothetical protein n=1 Tax=Streptomyces exfoliatus TaxID=1905 RepID=UPI003C2EFD2E
MTKSSEPLRLTACAVGALTAFPAGAVAPRAYADPDPAPGLADSGTSPRTYAAAALAVLSTAGGLVMVRRFRR